MADQYPTRDLAAVGAELAELRRRTDTALTFDSGQLFKQLEQINTALSEIQSTQADLAATVEFLQALTPLSAAGSGSGATGLVGWTSSGALRPSVSVSTPTGSILVTTSATLNLAVATFSIAGYVDRDAMISGANQWSQAYSGAIGDGATVTRSQVITGLPVNSPFTVQAEVYGFHAVNAFVVGVSIMAQPIP